MEMNRGMNMNLNLQKGGAYRSGIQALRKQVRSNGNVSGAVCRRLAPVTREWDSDFLHRRRWPGRIL